MPNAPEWCDKFEFDESKTDYLYDFNE